MTLTRETTIATQLEGGFDKTKFQELPNPIIITQFPSIPQIPSGEEAPTL